jgi:hypothetical protein
LPVIGVEAVKARRSVYFGSLADIIGALAKAEREKTLLEKIRFFCRFALLIVDEFGYLPVIPGGRNLFFQLVNARYEKGAMILTSNRGFSEWGRFLETPWSRPLCLTASSPCDRHPDRGGELSTSRACRSRAGKHPIEKPHPTIADPADSQDVLQKPLESRPLHRAAGQASVVVHVRKRTHPACRWLTI